MMIKINDMNYIIYNDLETLILFTDHREDNIPSCIEIFDNKKQLPNEYLKQNVDKKLSLKDKMIVLYHKSPMCRIVHFDSVFCGHRFETQQCNEKLEPKFREIYETLTKSIDDEYLDLASLGHTSNFHSFYCSNNEVEDLFENFKKLEEKHRKYKQEVVEEELEN